MSFASLESQTARKRRFGPWSWACWTGARSSNSPWDGTLLSLYTLAADAFGNATVTIKAKDSGGTANGGQDESASQTFTITVNAVNDEPEATDDDAGTTPEDTPLTIQTADLLTNDSSGPPNESGQTLTVTAVSNGQNGQPVLNNDNTVIFTPAQDFNGDASFDYTVCDDGGTANGGQNCFQGTATVKVTVSQVNDAPSFTKGADQTVDAAAGAQTVNGWATAISAGPADENGQTVEFIVTNDNNALFSTQPSVAPDGTLSYTPAADASGKATVTVKLKDSGGTANGGQDTSAGQTFTITVSADNRVPVISSVTNNGPVNEGSPATIKVTANDADSDTLSTSSTATMTTPSRSVRSPPTMPSAPSTTREHTR